MKINMNRRGFLKVTGAAAATTAVAPTALAEFAPTVLANVGETYYVECVDLNGPLNVRYYNRDSERFKAIIADRPDNWQIYWSLSREQMANNLGEHVVKVLEDNPENYVMSISPGSHLAFVVATTSSDDGAFDGVSVIDKMTLKENYKVWGLS